MEESVSDSSREADQFPKTLEWWHILFGFGLWIALLILSPKTQSLQFSQLKEGTVSPIKVIAPIDFEILKSEEELAEERRESVQKVLPILIFNDTINQEVIQGKRALFTQIYSTLKDFSSRIKSVFSLTDTTYHTLIQEKFLKEAFSDRIPTPKEKALWWLMFITYQKMGEPLFLKLHLSIDKAVKDLLSVGVLDRDKTELAIPSGKVAIERKGVQKVELLESFFTRSEAIAELLHHIEKEFDELPEEGYSMVRLWGEEFIKPNLIYDSVSTERARQLAISSVPLAKGIVKKDELIVDRHIRITPEIFAKLRSLDIKYRELREESKRAEWMAWLGKGLILSLVVVGVGGIMMRYYHNVWRDPKLIGVIIALWVLFHLFQIGIIRRWEILFLLPAGALGMLLVVTVGEKVSIPILAAVSLTTSYLSDYQWISGVIALILGVTGALGASAYQSRKEIVRCVVPLLIVGAILWIGLYLLGVMPREEMGVNGLAVIANAGLTPVVVLGMTALIETGFRITTNLKLVELVDLNQPLLRELANRVPGTYHHSLLLGSLAESAARAIGANGLLTRAGAYYHDIGKMEIGEYFIENLAQGEENVHDRLSPETSAQLVIEHVTRGIELGRKHRLPNEIIAFIPEHHGTSLVAYFYAKAHRNRGNKVEEEQFRYPGPKPRSRETGIVMLADSVEAATHSLDNPTTEEIAALVDSLFQMKINDGQLAECPLTFKELDMIKRSFIKTLSGVYHQRTQYPKISSDESSLIKGAERSEISTSISSSL